MVFRWSTVWPSLPNGFVFSPNFYRNLSDERWLSFNSSFLSTIKHHLLHKLFSSWCLQKNLLVLSHNQSNKIKKHIFLCPLFFELNSVDQTGLRLHVRSPSLPKKATVHFFHFKAHSRELDLRSLAHSKNTNYFPLFCSHTPWVKPIWSSTQLVQGVQKDRYQSFCHLQGADRGDKELLPNEKSNQFKIVQETGKRTQF